jgi:membrane protease subunit HflK
VAALVLWAATGIYIVDAAERGIVLRFGKYLETTQPGLHWRIPYPIDSVKHVNVKEVKNQEIGFSAAESNLHESLMLTRDENIIDIKISVQYRVLEPQKYLFKVRDPDATLKEITESALREIVGKSTMTFVITDGREEVQRKVNELSQSLLDRYETGLVITSVNIQNAQPPDQVQAAFADAVKAREDKQRYINDAQAYMNEKEPLAQGNAARQEEDSEAYKTRVVQTSQGEAERFLSVLQEYEKAPKVTRERLYLDTIEQVLSNSSKVVIDMKQGNNMVFLPLDRIIGNSRELVPATLLDSSGNTRESSESNPSSSSNSFGSSDDERSRRQR